MLDRMRPGARVAAVMSGWWRTERIFVIVLALGAVYRGLVMYAFPPAFVFSDGPTYLRIADALEPYPDRPVAYSFFLRGLLEVHRSLELVVAVQHLVGLATAVLIYVALRRLGVAALVAALATIPVLFDQLQVSLEHSTLSDALFMLMVLGAIVLVLGRAGGRSAPSTTAVALAGLLIGLSTLVRVLGGPLAAVFAVVLLLLGTSWRQRLVHVAVLAATVAAPVLGYMTWYHAENGSFTLVEGSGRPLYMRTTSFVDCASLDVEKVLRPLCPAEPRGERLDPTDYGWHSGRVKAVDPPGERTNDDAMRDFARAAVTQQPVGFAGVVLRDTAQPFWSITRDDHYEYDTAYKWQLGSWIGYEPTEWGQPSYLENGGYLPFTRQPAGDVLAKVGAILVVPGPLMSAILLVTVAGFVVRRPDRPSLRPAILLLVGCAFALIVVPNVTAQFTWRYQLPLTTLLPMAAALAWTRWRAVPKIHPAAARRPEAVRPG